MAVVLVALVVGIAVVFAAVTVVVAAAKTVVAEAVALETLFEEGVAHHLALAF